MESEAAEMEFYYKASKWAHQYRKEIAWGVAGAVLIGLITGFVIWRHDENQANANNALSQAFSQAQENPAGASPDSLLKVASDYSGTPAAQRALLLAGVNYFNEHKFPEA